MKKDKIKKIRTIIQIIILSLLLRVIILAFLDIEVYTPYAIDTPIQEDRGFISISYFGVDRTGSDTLISTTLLDSHIRALLDSGYVTITQNDILNYYNNNTPLPEKALFLMFEDGRRDTAIFAQKILEKHNYIASMLTYASNLNTKNSKFLSSSDLLTLEKNSFWELGTNGYRLSFINVFDRDEMFLDQLTSHEFQQVSSNLDRKYNHYLMDYIRDPYGIPNESYEEMVNRISLDYEMLDEIYTSSISNPPKLYSLMHSNTGQFGTNDKVSAVNEKWILALFEMNFNREGLSLNNKKNSIYDLTRIQPQPYWSTNHLLMKINDDTGQSVEFITGESNTKNDWEICFGAAEFTNNKIILTSLPRAEGLIWLKNNSYSGSYTVSSILKGNKKGSQSIYLNAQKDLSQYIKIELIDDKIQISEKANKDKSEQIREVFVLNPESVNDNNKQLDIKEKGESLIFIHLSEDKLSLSINDTLLANNININVTDKGYVGLSSSFSGYGYSQRNLYDEIYDGIFEDFTITSLYDDHVTLYSTKLSGREKIIYKSKTMLQNIVDWFIINL